MIFKPLRHLQWIWHFQSMNFICWFKICYFQRGTSIWNLAIPIRENHGNFKWNLALLISELQISYIWQFHLLSWNLVLADKEMHIRFSPSNQGISNVHMQLWTSKQANSYEISHFQTEKFIWKLAVANEIWHFQLGKFQCSYEIGHFQSENFIWNLSFHIREIQMFI